ncbi:MAG: alpha-2-macroglobulin family protein [Candidatus Limnocylindrales bacterium]
MLALIASLPMSALPGPLLAATDPGQGWGRVELPVPERLVELEPSEVDETGIPVDATFRLISHGAGPAGALAELLVVDPGIELSVDAGADPTVAELRPQQPLEPGSQLSFSLTGSDGARLGAWSFHVRTPVAVVETLPRHHRRDVPPTTGIELTFDRDGVLHPERAFSIEPPVKGRFERRGRVLSFIPRSPLQEDTVYRVTLSAGVGTGDPRTRTTRDTVVEFATRRAGQTRVRPAAAFTGRVAEARPGEPAIVEVYTRGKAIDRVAVDVFRFGSLEAVGSALGAVRSGSQWPYREHVIDTEDMQRLGSQQATLQSLDPWDRQRRALTLETPLSAGWYVLVIPARDGSGPGSQLILQVTDLSAYAHVTTTSSLFWVNDVGTGSPVHDAQVRLVGGPVLGRTDARGILQAPTPDALATEVPTPLVLVRSGDAAVYLPFGGASWTSPNIESWGRQLQPWDLAWSFLYTDRSGYRSSDSINVWGMFRDRRDGSVPQAVELNLRTDWDSYRADATPPPAIATASVRPSPNGVYSGSVSFEELPLGSYRIDVTADGESVGETWVNIIHIVKPAYRLDLSTNRRAFLAGENVRVSVAATFFDGTAVPGTPLTISSVGQQRTAITNASGRAVARLTARAGNRVEQLAHQSIGARPRRAEEGRVDAGTGIVVLPSSRYLDAQVRRAGAEIRVSGTVHEVDLERLERQIAKDIHHRLDPRGAPVPDAQVTARITETEWVRRQDGTVYDFIAKKVVPIYRYDAQRRRFPPQELVSGPDGAFTLIAPALADRAYEVSLTTLDPAGRTTRLTRDAWRPWPETEEQRAYLALAGSDEMPWRITVAEGETYAVELRQGPEPQPTGGANRYLFLLGQAGLQEAKVQRSPVHSFTFEPSHAPSVDIGAVRFTGTMYIPVPGGLGVSLDAESRRLEVELSPDRERYAPGETVELAVRTIGRDGEGVPASVVLRAVDEKLYAMDLAFDLAPLEELYRPVWSGTIRTYATHLLPSGLPVGMDVGGGEGDTAGGGRDDFRDWVLFEQIETDAGGEGRVRFDVSDDLTSWRVSATAVSERVEAGEATTLVPVGLPFFAELVTAREFVVGDTPTLRLRAYGPGLRADTPVTFTLSAPSLDLGSTRVDGMAFKTAGIALPPLAEGRHAITLDAVAVVEGVELHDRLTRQIGVRRSRLEQGRAAYTTLADGQAVPGGDGLTTIVISDAGRGRFYPDLVDLAWSAGPRADQALAAGQARQLLDRTFGEEAGDAPGGAFESRQFQARDGLIALLPYSSSSESLSLLVAIATPDAVDRAALLEGFRDLDRRRNVSRERKLQASVGRAVLGDDALLPLQGYLDDEGLTVYERLLLGIGLAAAGDEAGALELERGLLTRYGQQLGPWVRLWDEEDDRPAKRSAELTALLSILAAGVGDDAVAEAANAYVAIFPPPETLANLQRIAYISRVMERTPAAAASFSWQLDGEPQTVELDAGEQHQLTLTAPQREALRLSPLTGSLGVASSWREPLDPAGIAEDEAMVLRRTVSPAGVIRSSDLVDVMLTVGLGPAALDDCYLVTEVAPSGLAPLREGMSWRQRSAKDGDAPVGQQPWSISGQQVSWCVWPNPKTPARTLRYRARVVNSGSFLWEPAVVQSIRAPELIRLSEAGTLEIGAGSPDSDAGSAGQE